MDDFNKDSHGFVKENPSEPLLLRIQFFWDENSRFESTLSQNEEHVH